jgi:hypothetical protein
LFVFDVACGGFHILVELFWSPGLSFVAFLDLFATLSTAGGFGDLAFTLFLFLFHC